MVIGPTRRTLVGSRGLSTENENVGGNRSIPTQPRLRRTNETSSGRSSSPTMESRSAGTRSRSRVVFSTMYGGIPRLARCGRRRNPSRPARARRSPPTPTRRGRARTRIRDLALARHSSRDVPIRHDRADASTRRRRGARLSSATWLTHVLLSSSARPNPRAPVPCSSRSPQRQAAPTQAHPKTCAQNLEATAPHGSSRGTKPRSTIRRSRSVRPRN